MIEMIQLYPRMPGPSGAAILNLFAYAFASIVLPDPVIAASCRKLRALEQQTAIYLLNLRLVITAAPVGDHLCAADRAELAGLLKIDLLTVDLDGEAVVEVAVDYGSPSGGVRTAAPASALWLGGKGVYLIPVDRTGHSPSIQLTASGLVNSQSPYASEAERLDGLKAASLAAARACAAQFVADAAADTLVWIK